MSSLAPTLLMIALNVKEKFCKKTSGDDLPEFQVSEIKLTLLGKLTEPNLLKLLCFYF